MPESQRQNPAEETGAWLDLCAWEEVPADGGRYVLANSMGLAVFRDGDQPRVMDNACPHAGAALAGGFIDNNCVVCPWHGWAFNLKTGACPDAPDISVSTFPARVKDGRVQIQV